MDPASDPHQAAQLAQAQAEAAHIQHQIKLEHEIQQQHFLAQNAAAAQMSLFGQHNLPQAGANGLNPNNLANGIGGGAHNTANPNGTGSGPAKANNLILESSQTIDQVVSQNGGESNMQIESEEALNSSNNCGEDDDDAEGVWSPDIETCFTEALQMYPPCGRRKIILSEEGKMYGRNELIARYIKMRTGKVRSRKQVSSHIQVLARRKMREVQVSVKQGPISPVRKDSILTSLANMSSAQIVSAAANAKHLQQSGQMGFGYAGGNNNVWNRPGIGLTNEVQDAFTATRLISGNAHVRITHFEVLVEPSKQVQSKQGPDGTAVFIDRRGGTDDNNNQQVFKANHDKFHCILQINPVLSPNSIQMESIDICQVTDKFPRNKFEDLFDKSPNKECFYLIKFWADLNFDFGDYEENAFYSVTQQFESQMPVKLQVTTDVNSFGKEAVEKIEVESSSFDDTIGRHITRINKSSICEYMIKFIYILKNLENKNEMNTVLENFTLLQQVINRDTDELLFCIAFVFESSGEGQGPHHHIYQLVKGGNEGSGGPGGSPEDGEMVNDEDKM